MLPPLTLCALVWAAASFGASGTAIVRGRFVRPDDEADAGASEPAGGRSVLLVRPVSGDEAWLGPALSSVPRGFAGTADRLRIRIAVADVDDAAHPAAVRAVASLVARGIDAKLVLTAARGQNRKAAQLATVLAREPTPPDATREIVIVADADVDLEASPVPALAQAFDDDALGAIWAPPVERAPVLSLADRASQALLGGSLHAFPLLARLDPGGLVGKLCALRRSALDAVGGFDALVPWLGEDMQLAAMLRAAKIPFRATETPAVSVANGRTAKAVLDRYARWLQVIRAQRPTLLLGYPVLFFGALPAFACCLLAAHHDRAPFLSLVGGAVLLMRLVVSLVAARAAGRGVSWTTPLVDTLLADALLCAAFSLALVQRHVAWKTNRFTFDRRGQLQEAEEVPRAIA